MGRGELFYQKVRNDLEEKIKSGFYKKGEFIPSESSLEIYYNVSRTTIRNAIRDLVIEGFLTIVRGKGTQVSVSKIHGAVPNLMSFSDMVAQSGSKHSILNMSVKRIKPSEEIAKNLGVNISDDVVEFYRVRAMDDEPISIHISYLPAKYLGSYDTKLLEEKKSLYGLLRDDYGVVIQSALDKIRAFNADSHVASVLQVQKGDAILHLERIAYDQNNTIVEYSNVYFLGNRYVHTVITTKGN